MHGYKMTWHYKFNAKDQCTLIFLKFTGNVGRINISLIGEINIEMW